MKEKMKNRINNMLATLDLQLVRKSSHDKLLASASRFRDYELSAAINQSHFSDFIENLNFSKSQLRQDLFVLSELGFKQHGFFVEFGATNGIDLSNTYLMEARFGWNGILAEPARLWHR